MDDNLTTTGFPGAQAIFLKSRGWVNQSIKDRTVIEPFHVGRSARFLEIEIIENLEYRIANESKEALRALVERQRARRLDLLRQRRNPPIDPTDVTPTAGATPEVDV